MRPADDIEQTIDTYADTVVHVCMMYLHDQADRDDAFQDTFLKYAQTETEFNNSEHKKAWLIRVAANTCKDMLKRSSRRDVTLNDMEEHATSSLVEGDTTQKSIQAEYVASALRELDETYRTILYLTYFEDLPAATISRMLDMPENTVYTNLARGRKKLKEVLERD